MPDLKISQLPAASTPLAGTELVPIVQGGVTDKTTVADILTGTVPSGTANGVLFLNASKVVTSGSALTFDGTNFATTGVANIGNGARIQGAGSITGTGVGAEIFASGGVTYYTSYDRTGAAYAPLQYISDSYQAWNVSGEQMRLTSTGLGIGTSTPAYKLDVRLPQFGFANFEGSVAGGYSGIQILDSSQPVFQLTDGTNQFQIYGGVNTTFRNYNATGALIFFTNNTERARIDASGNLGLGVTPSAWGGVSKGFQISSITSLSQQSSGASNMMTNAYEYTHNAWKYIISAYTGRYSINPNDGTHAWYTAPSGTAGNPISFTQAMTLTAAGNLLLGTTFATGATMDIEGSNSGVLTLLNIVNTSTNAAAVTRLAIGSQGGNWFIDNERSSAILKFTRGTTVYLTMDSAENIITGSAAIATNATNGFLYVPSCAGTPTGTPTTYTGRVPIVVDTTNNKLYFYSGGTWRDAGP